MKPTDSKAQYTTLNSSIHFPQFDDPAGNTTYFQVAPMYMEGYAKAVKIPSGKNQESDGRAHEGYWVQIRLDGTSVYDQIVVKGDLQNGPDNPLQLTLREVDYCPAEGGKYKMIILCSEAYEDQSKIKN